MSGLDTKDGRNTANKKADANLQAYLGKSRMALMERALIDLTDQCFFVSRHPYTDGPVKDPSFERARYQALKALEILNLDKKVAERQLSDRDEPASSSEVRQ